MRGKLFSFRSIFGRNGYIVRRAGDSEESSASEKVQKNERIKFLSGLCKTLGIGLIGAGAARWFYTAVDVYTIFWLVIGGVLIWSGLHILTLLEAEE